jgi:hypothetical protein
VYRYTLETTPHSWGRGKSKPMSFEQGEKKNGTCERKEKEEVKKLKKTQNREV